MDKSWKVGPFRSGGKLSKTKAIKFDGAVGGDGNGDPTAIAAATAASQTTVPKNKVFSSKSRPTTKDSKGEGHVAMGEQGVNNQQRQPQFSPPANRKQAPISSGQPLEVSSVPASLTQDMVKLSVGIQTREIYIETNALEARYQQLQEDFQHLKASKEQLEKDKIVLVARNQHLNEENLTSVQANDDLEKRCRGLKVERDWNIEASGRLQEELDIKSNQLVDLQNHTTKIAYQKQLADGKIATLTESLGRYKSELQDEREKHAATKIAGIELDKQSKENAAELLKFMSEKTPLADDKFFASEWTKLRDRIFGWSHNHFAGAVLDQRALDVAKKSISHDDHLFRRLARDPEKYLASNREREYLIQSIIWSVLLDQVFAYPGRNRQTNIPGLFWSQHLRNQLDHLAGLLCPGMFHSAIYPPQMIS